MIEKNSHFVSFTYAFKIDNHKKQHESLFAYTKNCGCLCKVNFLKSEYASITCFSNTVPFIKI